MITRKLWWATLSLLVIMGLMLMNAPMQTVTAQDDTDFTVYVEFDAVVQSIEADKITFTNGDVVLVNDPNLIPATVMVGVEVSVVAEVVDNDFILFSITPKLQQENTPEATVEPTTEPTMEPTVEPTMEPTAAPTMAADCPQPPGGHPVAQRLADTFGVSYEEIMGWKCAGYGFGEITKAYALAKDTGKSAADIFAMREGGMGWGNIIKELGLNPGDYGNGKIIKAKDNNGKGHDKSDDKDNNGKGNDKSDDKGNNGKGNDKNKNGNNGNNNKGSDKADKNKNKGNKR